MKNKYKLTAVSKVAAFELAGLIFPSGWEPNEENSESAGYKIYDSTKDKNAWISDLGCRLELNLPDGECINIWIEDGNGEDQVVHCLEKELENIPGDTNVCIEIRQLGTSWTCSHSARSWKKRIAEAPETGLGQAVVTDKRPIECSENGHRFPAIQMAVEM